MNTAPCSGTGSQVTGGGVIVAYSRGETGHTWAVLFLQHCEINFEGEVRCGSMGALCLDAKTERVLLSPCPLQRPTPSRLQWKFQKARIRLNYFCYLETKRHELTLRGRSQTVCVCLVLQLSGQIVHQQSQLCLEAVKDGRLRQSSQREVNTHVSTGGLFLRPCTHHPRQQWHFEQLVAPRGA